MYGLPSPHNIESSSAYVKEEDKNQCGCKLFMRVLFWHNKEASNERMMREEWKSSRLCPSHAFFLYNICALNNFNIHQHNKEGIYLIGYQHYNHYNE